MSDAVVLAPHDPAFRAFAAAQSGLWRAALGDVLIRVEHIGSTAIPGILAKPVLDLLPIVTDLAALDVKRDAVEAMGFEWRGPFGLPGRRYCKRSDPAIHVHCYAIGNPEITRHLAFRDYLIANPSTAAAYSAQKQRCVALHPTDRIAYGDCKSDWIKRTEALALKGCTDDDSD